MALQKIGEFVEMKKFHDYLLSKIAGTEVPQTMEIVGKDFRWGFALEGVKENFFDQVIMVEAKKFFKEFGVERVVRDDTINICVDVPEKIMALAVWGSSTGDMMELVGEEMGDWLIANVTYDMLTGMQSAWQKEYEALQAAKKDSGATEEVEEAESSES